MRFFKRQSGDEPTVNWRDFFSSRERKPITHRPRKPKLPEWKIQDRALERRSRMVFLPQIQKSGKEGVEVVSLKVGKTAHVYWRKAREPWDTDVLPRPTNPWRRIA